MRGGKLGFRGLALFAFALPAAAHAADIACEGLVPVGQKMICAGFEPNWALELVCEGQAMTATFVDAFSGSGIVNTPGSVDFASSSPWRLSTSHGISGAVAYTPASCRDEGDNVHDFTFTPTAAPGIDPPFFPFCCRIE